MTIKFCRKCGCATERYLRKGLPGDCKPCSDAYRERNAQKYAELNAKYHLENKSAIAARNSANRAKNLEEKRRKGLEGYYKNRERDLARNAGYREQNKPRIAQNARKRRQETKSEVAAAAARRRAYKLRATPLWADQAAIRVLYAVSADYQTIYGVAYHVDHIIPLQSRLVCGLHCEHNLQIIPKEDNIKKGNRYWPDMP